MFCRVGPIELNFATALTAFADCFYYRKSISRGRPCQGLFFFLFLGPVICQWLAYLGNGTVSE